MNRVLKVFFLFFLFGCASDNEVFWCGNHACVDKKEKLEYFKKNMIVEIKEIGKSEKKENSKFNDIIQQGNSLDTNNDKDLYLTKKQIKQKKKDEKELAKIMKKNNKQRIKNEKQIGIKLRKDELVRIKNEKKLKSKMKLNENNSISNKKTVLLKNVNKVNKNKEVYKNSTDFSELVNIITKEGYKKSFPNINKNIK
tara:strand:+ start:162 stop:752 length:591 start_codon:yes stop_codon:yes gene_type:complete